jgi:hypothetical protein
MLSGVANLLGEESYVKVASTLSNNAYSIT